MNAQSIFLDSQALMVPDGDYYQRALGLITGSRRICIASIFIIDHNLAGGREALVDALLVEMASAAWRGVDVRLLVGGSKSNVRIWRSAMVALRRAQELGVDARIANLREGSSSHAKVLLADDAVLLGSHNWSASMFGGQVQDSIQVRGQALASRLEHYLLAQWTSAGEA